MLIVCTIFFSEVEVSIYTVDDFTSVYILYKSPQRPILFCHFLINHLLLLLVTPHVISKSFNKGRTNKQAPSCISPSNIPNNKILKICNLDPLFDRGRDFMIDPWGICHPLYFKKCVPNKRGFAMCDFIKVLLEVFEREMR